MSPARISFSANGSAAAAGGLTIPFGFSGRTSGYVEPREVHEKVVINGPAAYLKNPLIHHTYPTLNDYIKKMELTLVLPPKRYCAKKDGLHHVHS